jgi:tetratricopeptide (TPR) repeat protein
MSRCPTCFRRLTQGEACPADGGRARADPGLGAPPASAWALDGYQVERVLGVGGFGAVWLAQRASDGARVAVKVSHSSDVASTSQLLHEAAVLGHLASEHVPQVYASGLLRDGRAYLAMEHLAGRTLAQALASLPAQPTRPHLYALADAVLRAVEHLHAHDTLHGDLKPENVFLRGESLDAVLMDFGLAAGLEPRAGPAPAERIAGTPEYMAPEQFRGSRDLGPRTDVYALGVMLFELFTGRPPFVGSKEEVEYGHLALRPPRPSSLARVAQEVEAVVLRCLAKEPQLRFSNAGLLRRGLVEAIEQRRPSPPPLQRGATAPAGASGRQATQLKVALVFFDHTGDVSLAVQAAAKAHGGVLAHVSGRQGVAVFTHQAVDHPGRGALALARQLLAQRLVVRAIIDLGSVASKPKPDGTPRFMGAVLTEAARYPQVDDPEGLMLSAAAHELLPTVVAQAIPGREGYLLADFLEREASFTTLHGPQATLFGREATVNAAVAHLGLSAGQRQAGLVTLLGEQGLGKTCVGHELVRRCCAEFPSAQVIDLCARQATGLETDELMTDLLRATLELPPTLSAEEGQAALIRQLGEVGAEVWVGVGLLFGWLSPQDPQVQRLRAAVGVLRSMVARAGGAALARLASRQVVVVLLDDAHWADEAVLDALEQAMVSPGALAVVALARPSFEASRPTWGRRSAHHHRETLAPLSAESAGELCRQLLAPAAQVPEEVVRRLVERTGGNPMLLTDLVAGLKRDGLVRRSTHGGAWFVATEVLEASAALPLVEWLVSREVEALRVDLRAHAQLVSLLSAEFVGDEVDGVLRAMRPEVASAFPLDTTVGLAQLQEAGVLQRRRTGRLSFRNSELRNLMAKAVPEALRVGIHEAAHAFYSHSTLPPPVRLPRLAWHAAQKGARAEAASTYLTLAELARERHKYLDAETAYSSALQYLEEGDVARRLVALRGRGIMRYRSNRYDDALADFGAARGFARQVQDTFVEADLFLHESMALDWLTDYHRSRALAEQARPLVEPLHSALLDARLKEALGRTACRFNDEVTGIELLRAAAALAEPLGDPAYEVVVVSNLLLGFVLALRGAAVEAQERLDRVEALCRQKGDELHLGAMFNNRSCLWIMLNDVERFTTDSRQVLLYARRVGSNNLERMANLNAGYFHYWRGEHELAEPFVRRLIELDEAWAPRGCRPEGRLLLARVRWARGAVNEAQAMVAELVAQQTEAKAQAANDVLLAANDEVLLEVIRLVVQQGTAPQWEAALQRARQVAQGQELIEILELRGIVAAAARDLPTAREALREALEVGQRTPNVMGERISQRLGALSPGCT